MKHTQNVQFGVRGHGLDEHVALDNSLGDVGGYRGIRIVNYDLNALDKGRV